MVKSNDSDDNDPSNKRPFLKSSKQRSIIPKATKKYKYYASHFGTLEDPKPEPVQNEKRNEPSKFK